MTDYEKQVLFPARICPVCKSAILAGEFTCLDCTPPPEPLYYIANRRPVGNCVMWWRVEGHGYTYNLDEAWKVPESEARDICRRRPDMDKMHRVEIVEAAARRHVDYQLLAAAEDDASAGASNAPAC